MNGRAAASTITAAPFFETEIERCPMKAANAGLGCLLSAC